MKKAYIYVRVSTEEQAKHGFSIAAQQKNDFDFALKNEYQVAGIYMDEGKSAKNMERPQLQALLSDLKKDRSIEAVIVWKLDRITRNNEDYHARIKPLLNKLNVKLLSATENNDFDNPMGDFFRNLGISQAELERHMISARTKAGMMEKISQGHYPSKPPIGYNIATVDGKKIIVQDPEKASFIKKAFEYYATGAYTLREVEIFLNDEGFPCSKKMIENMFNKFAIFYTGKFIWVGKQYDGAHEPIISSEVYEAAMTVKNGGKPTFRRRHDFLYKGILKCKIDGRNLTAQMQRGEHKSGIYKYYYCTGKRQGLCSGKVLKEEHIDEAVINELKKLHLEDSERKILREEVRQILNYQAYSDEKAKKVLDQKINTLKNRLNKLYEDRLDGEISEEFYQNKKLSWENELSDLALKYSGVIKYSSQIFEDIDLMFKLSENLAGTYTALSFEKKRELLKILCSNLFWDGENLDIELNRAIMLISKMTLLNKWGPSGDKFKTLVNELIETCIESDNIIFFERLKIFMAA